MIGNLGNPSFSVISGALASAVANAGTFAPSYPTGKDTGNFYLAGGHKLVIGSDVYFYPVDFDVTLNSTTITVTNKTTATWPAGATFRLQMNEQGERAMLSVPIQDPNAAPIAIGTTVATNVNARSKLIPNMTAAYADLITLGAPIVAATNNICTSQSLATSGALSVNGAIATGGVATLDNPRAVRIVSSGADTAVLTVRGTDVYGFAMSEAITLNGTTVVSGKKAFKTVTSITASAAIANLCTVGTTDILGLPIFLPSGGNIVGELRSGIDLNPDAILIPFVISQVDMLAKTTQELVSPIGGNVRRMAVTTQLTVVTGGVLTARVTTTAVTGLTLTVADASVPGTSQQKAVAPTDGTDVVAAGGRLNVTVGTSFATSGAMVGSLYVVGSDGTVVAGVRTAGGATTTTGDVRGTYTPSVACDGTPIQLLVILPDRSLGQTQA